MLLIRLVSPLVGCAISYLFFLYVAARSDNKQSSRVFLLISYVISRLSLWLLFFLYLEKYVASSDPLYSIDYIGKFLSGAIPVRDFPYPYGPFMIPSEIPFYLLTGRNLAGISMFTILAEAAALTFFLKACRISEDCGELDNSWITKAMALYILNPTTLYYTVLQGYNSIIQTAYSMLAIYLLLRSKRVIGYSVGFFGLAGSKLLSILDWPAMLVVRRPRWNAIAFGAIPLVVTYVIYQVITGDAFVAIRSNIDVASEGNVWFLSSMLHDFSRFFAGRLGRMLPLLSFLVLYSLGSLYWLVRRRRGSGSYSFPAALGVTTFTIALFFICSRYTAACYVPILMLPASLIATSPTVGSRLVLWSFLLVSSLGMVGNSIWSPLREELGTGRVFMTAPPMDRMLAGVLALTVIVRVLSFGVLAYAGLRLAVGPAPVFSTPGRDERH